MLKFCISVIFVGYKHIISLGVISPEFLGLSSETTGVIKKDQEVKKYLSSSQVWRGSDVACQY